MVVIAAAPAGLLSWHPWSPDDVGRQKPTEFTTAPDSSPRFGTDEQLYPDKVRAGNGLDESPEQSAAEVDAVLGDERNGRGADTTCPAGPDSCAGPAAGPADR